MNKKEQKTDEPEPGKAVIARIADLIKEEAKANHFRPGTRLPSANQIRKTHRLSHYYAVGVLDKLVQTGFAEKRHGKGTFMLSQEEKKPFTQGEIKSAGFNVRVLEQPSAPELDLLKNRSIRLDLNTPFSDLKLVNKLMREFSRFIPTHYPGDWASAERELVELMLPLFAEQRSFAVPAAQCAVVPGKDMALRNVICSLDYIPGKKIMVPETISRSVFAVLYNSRIPVTKLPGTSNSNFVPALLSSVDPAEIGGVVVETRCDQLGGTSVADHDADILLALSRKHRFSIIELDYEHELGPLSISCAYTKDQCNVVHITTVSCMAHALYDMKLVCGPADLVNAVRTLSASCSIHAEFELRAIIAVLTTGILKELLPDFHQRVRTSCRSLFEAMDKINDGRYPLFRNSTDTAVMWHLPKNADMEAMSRLTKKMNIRIPDAPPLFLDGTVKRVLRLNAFCLDKDSPFDDIAKKLFLVLQPVID